MDNREQIIKALECCQTHKKEQRRGDLECMADKCPAYPHYCYDLDGYALSLIKELTEENEKQKDLLCKANAKIYELQREIEGMGADNERLKAENNDLAITVKDLRFRNKEFTRANKSLSDCAEKLQFELAECVQIKADTVQKMRERLKALAYYRVDATVKDKVFVVCVDDIDQIAKEMLESEK